MRCTNAPAYGTVVGTYCERELLCSLLDSVHPVGSWISWIEASAQCLSLPSQFQGITGGYCLRLGSEPASTGLRVASIIIAGPLEPTTGTPAGRQDLVKRASPFDSNNKAQFGGRDLRCETPRPLRLQSFLVLSITKPDYLAPKLTKSKGLLAALCTSLSKRLPRNEEKLQGRLALETPQDPHVHRQDRDNILHRTWKPATAISPYHTSHAIGALSSKKLRPPCPPHPSTCHHIYTPRLGRGAIGGGRLLQKSRLQLPAPPVQRTPI